jgi:hypothetical protein
MDVNRLAGLDFLMSNPVQHNIKDLQEIKELQAVQYQFMGQQYIEDQH